jgi:hypothetical protein
MLYEITSTVCIIYNQSKQGGISLMEDKKPKQRSTILKFDYGSIGLTLSVCPGDDCQSHEFDPRDDKDTTIILPTSLVSRFTEWVRSFFNDLVYGGLELYLDNARKDKIRASMLKALEDPLFMADVDECIGDFNQVDNEWARIGN